MKKTYHAECPCGALCLEVTGEPVHNHACTCSRCQRISGSAAAHNAWFSETDVRIVSGEYSTWYPKGPERPGIMKAFCPICGGGGFSRTGDYLPATVVIAAGTFADPAFPRPDHVHWWGNRPDWIEFADAIDRLPGN